MNFEVLSAEGADAARWTALVESLHPASRDIHFLPDYGRIYRDAYGFTPLLAHSQSAEGSIIQPFVRRPLRELAFLKEDSDAARFSDIANPYGFGGALGVGSGDLKKFYVKFAEAFAQWCDDENIAAEFACLHPFIAEDQRALVSDLIAPRHEKDVVFFDLTEPEANLLKDLRKGHRSSITKARRTGVDIQSVEPSQRNLALFNEMYQETMRRRQAAQRWLVPDNFFEITVRHLGAKRITLLFAGVAGAPESACLLMHDFNTAYYHFAATFAQHPDLGVNNLMVFDAALRMKAAGYARFHLGGGVTAKPDDSLFLFKAGFSSRRAPLYTYFCVRDAMAYAELCSRKRTYEVTVDGVESTSDFLPLYRR